MEEGIKKFIIWRTINDYTEDYEYINIIENYIATEDIFTRI